MNITNFDFEEKFGEGFDAKLNVKFIIHGFNGGEKEWPLVSWTNSCTVDLTKALSIILCVSFLNILLCFLYLAKGLSFPAYGFLLQYVKGDQFF